MGRGSLVRVGIGQVIMLCGDNLALVMVQIVRKIRLRIIGKIGMKMVVAHAHPPFCKSYIPLVIVNNWSAFVLYSHISDPFVDVIHALSFRQKSFYFTNLPRPLPFFQHGTR